MSAESITINRPQVPSVYPPSSMASAVSNIDKVGKSFNTRLAGMEGFIGTPKNTSIIDHSLSRLRADGMTNRLFADSTPGAQQAKKSDYIDLMPKLLESIQSLSTSSSSPSSTSDSSSTLNIITRGGGGGLSASAIRKLVRISRDTSCWISGKSVGNSIGETKGGSSNSSPSSASRRYTLDKKDQSSAAAEHVKFADRIWSVWFHDTLAIILHALRQVGEVNIDCMFVFLDILNHMYFPLHSTAAFKRFSGELSSVADRDDFKSNSLFLWVRKGFV